MLKRPGRQDSVSSIGIAWIARLYPGPSEVVARTAEFAESENPRSLANSGARPPLFEGSALVGLMPLGTARSPTMSEARAEALVAVINAGSELPT